MTATIAAPRTESLAVSFDDVQRAAARLAGMAERTPLFHSRTLDAVVGAEIWFKAEQFQRSGSFKFRGAYNAIAALPPRQRARGVVAFSSGNHAGAVALASRAFGCPATIVMPTDAPEVKVVAARAYGAEVVFYDRWTQDREAIGRTIAEGRGLTMIPPYNHPDVIAGSATVALEMFEERPDLDVVLAPIGGGGLISGTGLVAAAVGREVRVLGVEPAAADDARQSLRLGERVTIDPPDTIADGLRTRVVGDVAFPIMRRHVHGVVTVSEDEIVAAVRHLAGRLKLLVEASGAVAAAAVLTGRVDAIVGRRVGVVLSGGNIDPAAMAGLLASAD